MPQGNSVTNINYRPFKVLVVGSSPTQPKIFYSDGLGLHSSRINGAALHWLDD
jgi:hypothetical protein